MTYQNIFGIILGALWPHTGCRVTRPKNSSYHAHISSPVFPTFSFLKPSQGRLLVLVARQIIGSSLISLSSGSLFISGFTASFAPGTFGPVSNRQIIRIHWFLWLLIFPRLDQPGVAVTGLKAPINTRVKGSFASTVETSNFLWRLQFKGILKTECNMMFGVKVCVISLRHHIIVQLNYYNIEAN